MGDILRAVQREAAPDLTIQFFGMLPVRDDTEGATGSGRSGVLRAGVTGGDPIGGDTFGRVQGWASEDVEATVMLPKLSGRG